MVKVTTFNDRPVRHVRYVPDGSVIPKLYERRPSGRARHLRVSLAQWLAGRGNYLLKPRVEAGPGPSTRPLPLWMTKTTGNSAESAPGYRRVSRTGNSLILGFLRCRFCRGFEG